MSCDGHSPNSLFSETTIPKDPSTSTSPSQVGAYNHNLKAPVHPFSPNTLQAPITSSFGPSEKPSVSTLGETNQTTTPLELLSTPGHVPFTTREDDLMAALITTSKTVRCSAQSGVGCGVHVAGEGSGNQTNNLCPPVQAEHDTHVHRIQEAIAGNQYLKHP